MWWKFAPIAADPANITQYVAVVLVYPKGERLILAIYILLVPYAVIGCDAVMRRLTGATESTVATTDG